MSHAEQTGKRDLAYSRFHRPRSLARLIPLRIASRLSVIDIDWCEYCDRCKDPIALIETERAARSPKPATVTARLAQMSGITAFSIAYEVEAQPSTHDCPGCQCNEEEEPVGFRIRQIQPFESTVTTYTQAEFAQWLCTLRRDHHCRT